MDRNKLVVVLVGMGQVLFHEVLSRLVAVFAKVEIEAVFASEFQRKGRVSKERKKYL